MGDGFGFCIFCGSLSSPNGVQMVDAENLYRLLATQTWNGERFELKLTDEPSKFGGTPLTKGGVYDMISFVKKFYPNSFK